MWKGLDDVLKVFNGGRNCHQADIRGSFGHSFERVLMLVQEYLVLLLNRGLGVQDLGEVEWNSYVDVG